MCRGPLIWSPVMNEISVQNSPPELGMATLWRPSRLNLVHWV